jgi:hypothetical protein
MIQLKTDPEFKSLIPPLSNEEYHGLEQKLINEGFDSKTYGTIAAWNGIIIDGHNRYEICKKHNIVPEISEREFKNRDEVIDWIIKNQLGRRNLNPEKMSYLRGLQMEREKKRESFKGNQYTQNEVGEKNSPTKTAERLAKQHGVDQRTIYMDAEFARSIQVIEEEVSPEVKDQILNKEIKTTRRDIIRLVKDTPKEQLKEVFKDTSKPIKSKKEDKPVKKTPDKPKIEETEVKKELSGEESPSNHPLISIAQIEALVRDFLGEAMPYALMFDKIQLLSEFEKQAIAKEIRAVEEWAAIFRNALNNIPTNYEERAK